MAPAGPIIAPMSTPDPFAAARAAYERGEHERVRALLLGQPSLPPPALLMLGNSAIALGEDALALHALGTLHARQPHPGIARTLAGLHNRDGARLRAAGRDDEARQAFERGLRFAPTHRELGYNLAQVLRALGRHHEALSRLDAHLAAHPDDVEARWFAIEWRAAGDPEGAAARVSSPLDPGRPELDVPDPPRLAHVAFALQQGEERAAARVLLARAHAATGQGTVSPGLRYELAARLALPRVMRPGAQIDIERANFAANVEALEAEWSDARLARCEASLEQLAWSNFFLAYHGRDDRALQEQYARWLERAARMLAPALAHPLPGPRARRVAFVSSSFRECTAGAYFGRWVDWLTQAGFETHVFQLGPQRDESSDGYARRASQFTFHDGTLDALAGRVREAAPALVIYPELGMDARLLPLAAVRLAPRQAMGWGHPVTSGLSTLDAFFTCAAMEPPDAQAHYGEALVPLPGLGVDYARPPAPPPATRAALGLPSHAPLVLFPQSLFKIHPDNDAVLDALAAARPDVRFVVFEGEHPRWRPTFEARQSAAVRARLHWMPTMPRARYLQVNAACDLMLDTLHWSGGNTSLDALSQGLPVLTCPGATMRSRQSHAMLSMLGVAVDLSLPRAADLAARAAALLGAPAELARLRAVIVSGLPRLFDPEPARVAFVAAVERLCTPS